MGIEIVTLQNLQKSYDNRHISIFQPIIYEFYSFEIFLQCLDFSLRCNTFEWGWQENNLLISSFFWKNERPKMQKSPNITHIL